MLQIGFGAQEITPSAGVPLGGFIARENRPSTHVDSPLLVRCLVVEAGGAPFFLFNFDLLGIGQDLERRLLSALELGLGLVLPPGSCLLTATHTHSAPVVTPLSGEAGPELQFLEQICTRTVLAARTALQSLQPVDFFGAELRLPGLTYNRRAVLVDGRVSISPEPDLPVVERGPVDDRLVVLAWRNAAGETVAALAHFACHGVAVLSQGIGADIPGELAGRIGAALGGPCLFLQGAAGDINPTTVTAGRSDLLAWVEKAAGLEELNDRLHPLPWEPFQTVLKEMPLEYSDLPDRGTAARQVRDFERIASGQPEELEAADLQETIRAFKNTMNLPPDAPLNPETAGFVARALAAAGRKTLAAIEAGRTSSPPPLRLAAWRLGRTVLVFVSAELFASTGLRIRALRPDINVLPVSYLSPVAGYLPDRAAMDRGGYEVDDAWRFYGHPAPFRADTEERLVEEVGRMLASLI